MDRDAPPPERSSPEERSRRSRRSRALGWIAAGAAVLAVALAGAWFTCGFQGCPDPGSLAAWEPGGAPVVLDGNGEEFATLLPVQREIVALDSLPEHVGQAFIAVEDRRFRSHGGVDLRRVGGALLANIRAGGVEEGGSTITMQLARNAFPEHLPASERNLRRKLAEVRVALQIEDRFEKDEILGLYLNQIYFGNGATGIAAAARHYFEVPPTQLAPEQAALLAAMVKAPAHYDPREDPEEALERRNLVLDLMLDAGFLGAEEHARARETGLEVVPRERAADTGEALPAPWYLEAVRRELDEALGPELHGAQLRVHTALDPELQAAAERALLDQLAAVESGRYGRYGGPPYDPDAPPDSAGAEYLQGAVVALDPRDGGVLALVGGRNHRHSSFDHVVDADRQVGSAFKPFVYGAALARGIPPSHRLDDTPVSIELRGSPTYEPSNYDGEFDGPMTAREALRRSRNVPTVRLAGEIGTDAVADFARSAGIEADIPRGPSMALGTVTLSPMELAAAYATFAGLGRSTEPRFIRRVETKGGRVLWQSEPETEQRIDPGVAYILNDMLADVVDGGTGSAVRSVGFRGRAAGKTGTTQEAADVWFVGYTPEVVGVVWMGFDHPAPILPDATGGRLAAPVWGRMMARAGRSGADWDRPEGVVRRAPSGCPGAPADLFLGGMTEGGGCLWAMSDSLRAGSDTLSEDSARAGTDTTDASDTLPELPDTARPDTTAPDTIRPDTTRPDTTRPDTTPPDTIRPDTAAADTTRPDTTAPDTTRPDTTRPATAPPDTTRPDTTAPDTASPSAARPHAIRIGDDRPGLSVAHAGTAAAVATPRASRRWG